MTAKSIFSAAGVLSLIAFEKTSAFVESGKVWKSKIYPLPLYAILSLVAQVEMMVH
jgi:hypothetical protein